MDNESIEMKPIAPVSINENSSIDADKPKAHRCTLRNLVNLILILQKSLKRASAKIEKDATYWQNLAVARGEENERYIRIMFLQRQRIETLESDLRTLVNLAKETQQMLAGIAAEKRESDELPILSVNEEDE
ncbi:uncharacterized protein Dwil_GK19070 [Drosophila willistoni]|uniref:Uncharacterized protein n=1 Tax=Drosophila willistoni TaxID=7260 RepID=B4MWT0_DROWI|nr:uncharacterized protein LOC6642154 [Drosophila willistoni]EDW76569.1 uncharacterized protein Dwil_GK19070 [Drosophila willistoni]